MCIRLKGSHVGRWKDTFPLERQFQFGVGVVVRKMAFVLKSLLLVFHPTWVCLFSSRTLQLVCVILAVPLVSNGHEIQCANWQLSGRCGKRQGRLIMTEENPSGCFLFVAERLSMGKIYTSFVLGAHNKLVFNQLDLCIQPITFHVSWRRFCQTAAASKHAMQLPLLSGKCLKEVGGSRKPSNAGKV